MASATGFDPVYVSSILAPSAICSSSSNGRVPAFQAGCCESESRLLLHPDEVDWHSAMSQGMYDDKPNSKVVNQDAWQSVESAQWSGAPHSRGWSKDPGPPKVLPQ